MSDNQDYIWAELYNAIGNEYGVAGLMGNLQAESGNISYRLQGDFTGTLYKSINYTDNVDNGTIDRATFISDQKGYGLAQWTFSSRKADYYDWVQNGGYSSIGDVQAGVSFLIHELQTSYPTVWSALVNATDIRSASDIVLHQFENPAEQGEAVEIYRAGLGTTIYNESSTGQPVPVPVPTPTPTPTTPTIPLWLLFKVGK